MKRLKEERGFTLIELIVVLAIIGILAALIIPSVAGYTESAKKKAAMADGKNLQTALLIYRAENGTYPADTDWDGLKTALSKYISLPDQPTNYTFVSYKRSTGDSFELVLKAGSANITVTPATVTIQESSQ